MIDLFNTQLDVKVNGAMHSFPMISHIAGNLYQGGCRADGILDLPVMFNHVIQATPNHSYVLHEHVLTSEMVALMDSKSQGLGEAFLVAERLSGIHSSEPVLVHCQMGLNRSGAIMAKTLMLKYGMSAEQAIRVIRKKRSPAALFNTSFRNQLKASDLTSAKVMVE